MLSVRAALQEVLANVASVGHEQVSLARAPQRVLAKSVEARRTVPPFDNSAMDGFAVRASDLTGASPAEPLRLRVVATLVAGGLPTRELEPGTAVHIMTGAPLPPGADTVVRLEEAELDGDSVVLTRAPRPGEHVRRAGEDIAAGAVVCRAGQSLGPAELGLLASQGITSVTVYRRPRVAILATGDELVGLGEPLAPGKIANSNAYALAAAAQEAGGEVSFRGIVPDDEERAAGFFAAALEQSDFVLSTGGVSMGKLDLVRQVYQRLGVREHFWKVRQKPGKPLSFGTRDRTLVFGLPGNPVSALVCFYLYVRPALLRAGGFEEIFLPMVEAQAGEDLHGSAGLTDWVRCILDGAPGCFSVRSTGNQSSAVLSSLSIGNALAMLPEESTLVRAGEQVRALWLTPRGSAAFPF